MKRDRAGSIGPRHTPDSRMAQPEVAVTGGRARDQADRDQALGSYKLVFTAQRPPASNDLGILRRMN